MNPTWWRGDAVDAEIHGWRFEVRGDEIADIRHHGVTVLRAVRAAVRDHGWQTVPVAVARLDRDAEALTLLLRHEGLGARISSTLSVRALPGRLTIEWDARNEIDFDTCRAGLVALHPASDAGQAAVVTHPDGSQEPTRFPDAISPHQPIREIRELRLDDGTVISFAGDVFEMEDQRNWTDASFKTYSRPLDLPYPYPLPAGERVRQSLTITAPDAPASARARPADAIDLAETGRFPDVGVESSTAPDPVPRSSAGRFRVVELDLATPSWPAALERAARDGLPLDVRLVAAGDEALDPVAAALVGRPVARVTAFDRSRHVTTAAIARSLRAALDGAGVAAPIGSGARSHFTELNREQHELARDVDAVTMTTTPLFHTLDTEQLVEAVAMQRLIAEQAVRIAGGLPVHIGPVSLRPRYNNVATSPQPLPSRDDLAEGYGAEFTGAADERQGAPELAAWVVASAAALAVPGVETLSWFETWGPRGLADASGERPVSHAIACLAELHGAALLSGASPDGLVWAIGGRRGDGDTVLAANLDRTQRSFVVRIAGGAAHEVTLAAGAWTRIG